MVLFAGAWLLAGNSPAVDTAAIIPKLTADRNAEASLTISFAGLRSAKGLMRICLTRNPHFFPGCDKDPHAFKASVAAGPSAQLRIPGITSGDYALSVLHDENANARADMLLGIPREGVGFSENPRLRFSAPKFDAARFHMGSADVTKMIRIRYFL
ncbi:DUF2141 domain-containing protein [soil metagenome]